MARMSIDDKFLRDPRVKMLGGSLGISHHEARSRLLDVWAVCYDRATAILDCATVDLIAEIEGFAAAMVRAGLATDRSGQRSDASSGASTASIKISGASDRVSYLEANRQNSRSGGIRSGEVRRMKSQISKRLRSDASEAVEALANPNTNTNTNTQRNKKKKLREEEEIPEEIPRASTRQIPDKNHAPCQLEWFAFWGRQHPGQRPTWTGRHAKALSVLLSQHGAEEFRRRLALLEKSPPRWPPPPWDFLAFCQHFDRILDGERSSSDARFGRVEPHEDYGPPGEVAL